MSSKDKKAPGSPGKPDFQGEAHKLYMQHGKVQQVSQPVAGECEYMQVTSKCVVEAAVLWSWAYLLVKMAA